MKKKILNILKKNIWLRKIARKILYRYRYFRYKWRSIGQKVDPNLMVFCTFNGKSYSDSPKAIYEYLLKQKEYENYCFIWFFKDIENYQYLEKNRNTKIVKKGSKEEEKCMAKAKYWIFNYRALDHQFPKKNQVFIQCWHGTPLKRLGYDLTYSDNAMNSLKEIRKKYELDAKKITYFLSPNSFSTEKFISAWNLKKHKKENSIIEEGYPRNDILSTFNQEDVNRIRKKMNLEKIKKKIILYAPTWRDNSHQSDIGYTYQVEVDFDALKTKLEKDYIILFRAHYLVSNSFDFEKYKGFVYDVSTYDDINELYIISDILITDYSSVFFDYAILKKPIILYMYDLEEYRDKIRGFYLSLSSLPFLIAKNEKELLKEIKKTEHFTYINKYKKFNTIYNYLNDGNATKRVIERCIKNEKDNSNY